MEDAVTAYSTDDVEKNKLLREKVAKQEQLEIDTYNQSVEDHYDQRDFMDLEDAFGYDRAVELTRDKG
jgi:hypothetical protein